MQYNFFEYYILFYLVCRVSENMRKYSGVDLETYIYKKTYHRIGIVFGETFSPRDIFPLNISRV